MIYKLVENPLVSVIIPCYNAALTLAETVTSVLEQTYKNVEIIIVDDGSTDNSRDVAVSFGSRVTYIPKENGGPAGARNLGIRRSRGELIAFLDADDLWLPEKLSKQINFLHAHPDTALLCSAVNRKYENGSTEIKSCSDLPDSRISFVRLWQDNPITTSTVVCHREVFTAVGNFDENKTIQSVEDYDLWLRIAGTFTVRFLDEPLAVYNVSNQGLNRSNLERTFTALLYTYEKQRSSAQGRGLTETDLEIKRYYLYKLCGIRLFGVNSFGQARKYLLLALRHYWSDPVVISYLLATFFPENFILLLKRLTWRRLSNKDTH